MKTKQIHAGTMQEALAMARRDLGEDVILIDQKKASGGKGVVVTFAVDGIDEVLFDDEPSPYVATLDSAFATNITRPTTSQVELNHPAFDIITEAMAYHALPPALAERIRVYLQRMHLKPDHVMDVAETALAEALATCLTFQPIATAAKAPPAKALMLVGPHGVGKTSTIAKLATELTMHKQRVVLISTDLERLGGTDALQKLSEILKCPFHISDTRADLKGLLATYQGKAWVLIDSSGANIYEFAPLKALGELASLQGIEPILTCPAGMDVSEAQEMASVFHFLNIERMIVTRLDAVRRLGSLFAVQSTGGYALCNLTNSAIPSDACVPISAAALARLMLRHIRARMIH